MKLTNFTARYHRNGVSGAPFYLCQFQENGETLLATVFTDNPSALAVVNPSSIKTRYRPEYFADAIRAEIDALGDEVHA